MSHAINIKVRGYHLNLFRHVNNARYLEFLEDARWSILESKGYLDFIDRGGYTFAGSQYQLSPLRLYSLANQYPDMHYVEKSFSGY